MDSLITHATMAEFPEYSDVILRVFTQRGSCPIVIVDNGARVDAEDIGNQILSLFNYTVQSEVFNTAK